MLPSIDNCFYSLYVLTFVQLLFITKYIDCLCKYYQNFAQNFDDQKSKHSTKFRCYIIVQNSPCKLKLLAFFFIILFSVEEIESAAVPPKFIKKITRIEVLEGNPARFDCKVTGSPRPEIKWFREDEEIESSPYMRIQSSPDGSSSLIIQEVFADDTGRFTVKASNPAGEVQSSAHLVVQGSHVCAWISLWSLCRMSTDFCQSVFLSVSLCVAEENEASWWHCCEELLDWTEICICMSEVFVESSILSSSLFCLVKLWLLMTSLVGEDSLSPLLWGKEECE